MIDPIQLAPFFPPIVSDRPAMKKYMVKEYLQMLLLEHLSTTPYIRKLCFIGGANLRLAKGN